MAILASVSGMSTCLMVHAQITTLRYSRVKTMAGKAHLNIFELFKTEQSHNYGSQLSLACCMRNSEKGPSRQEEKGRKTMV